MVIALFDRLAPVKDAKMEIHSLTDLKTPPPSRRSSCGWDSDSRRSSTTDMLPHTPPQSTTGSPRVKTEIGPSSKSEQHFPVRLHYPDTPLSSPVRLPSLEEFDQGVEALARSYGPAAATPATSSSSWMSSSPAQPSLPSISQAVYEQQKPLPPPLQPYSHSHSQLSSPTGMYPQQHMVDYGYLAAGYPSPPPDLENRHCNKKYTTEEGDFIIYAWHDKKQKWQSIQKDFARLFGTTPERTIQGLQAWYYRMNQRIPVWDRDGYLVFDDDDDLEPRYISIKCRERDAVHKSEPLGLAQRYPERAMHYHWVDPDIKRQSSDWAHKRTQQYQDRKERRKRKEQRRSRL